MLISTNPRIVGNVDAILVWKWFRYLYTISMELTYFNSIKRLIFLMEIVQKATFFSSISWRTHCSFKMSANANEIVIKRIISISKCFSSSFRNVPSGHSWYQFTLLHLSRSSKKTNHLLFYIVRVTRWFLKTATSANANTENHKVNVDLMFTLD